MLIVPIKRKWFDMIRAGEKREEYRALNAYWYKRFCNAFNLREITNVAHGDTHIVLRNGYGTNRPELLVRASARIGKGRAKWGAEPGKDYIILDILAVCDTPEGTAEVG